MPRTLKCTCGLPTCKTCYKREYNRAHARARSERKTAMADLAENHYPRRHEVVLWETSDGLEFSTELEAAYHQLGIYKRVAADKGRGL